MIVTTPTATRKPSSTRVSLEFDVPGDVGVPNIMIAAAALPYPEGWTLCSFHSYARGRDDDIGALMEQQPGVPLTPPPVAVEPTPEPAPEPAAEPARKPRAPRTPRQAAEAPPAEPEAPAPSPEPEPVAEPPAQAEVSIEMLRAAAKAVIDAGRGGDVKRLLEKLGAASVSDVKPADRAAALAELQLT